MINYHPDIAEQHRFMLTTGINRTVTYEEFVCNLIKDMGSVDNDIAHMVLGIAGESGEIVDAIKKRVIYDKPLDVANVIEELGDLEFYMAGLRQRLGISRLDTLEANVTKLQKRYKDGYSDAAAQARADKEKEAVGKYNKLLAEQGKVVAVNLPTAAIEGTDDMASIETSEREARPAVPSGVSFTEEFIGGKPTATLVQKKEPDQKEPATDSPPSLPLP